MWMIDCFKDTKLWHCAMHCPTFNLGLKEGCRNNRRFECVFKTDIDSNTIIIMKQSLYRKFIAYLCNNFIGNFLGFVIGMGSTRLVSQFFTTRSIKNIWGLTAHKTVVDKQTFHVFEWLVSIIVGFIVFELISKWIQKKTQPVFARHAFTRWMNGPEEK